MKNITFIKDKISLDIRFSLEDNTIWMTQNEMATLFSTSKQNIYWHLNKTGQNKAVVKSDFTTGADGKSYKMSFYPLDVIRQIGFKINPQLTQEFYDWCLEELKTLNRNNIPIQSNIIRFSEGNVLLDVQVVPNEETVYLSQDQIATLFDTTIPNISMHIKNIYESGELEKGATLKDFLIVQNEHGRDVARNITQYNLDMILAIGYKVNSKKGIIFRKWATGVLKQYSLKGYAVNESRLALLENNYSYLQEDIKTIRKKIKEIDEVVKVKIKKETLFYEGEVFDAYDFICEFVRNATNRIIFIDPYIDEIALSILKNKSKEIESTIITTNKCHLSNIDINTFIEQYGELKLIRKSSFHDRFIIIDNNLYILGPSINRLGHNISAVIKIDNRDLLTQVEYMCCS